MNWDEIYLDFENKLKEAELLDSDIQKLSNVIILLCKHTLTKLNKSIEEKGFNSESEEINFFKNIKSFPLSRLIYYKEVRSIEIAFPKAGRSSQLKYLRRHIKRINKFYSCNVEFAGYVEQGNEYFDSLYFTRKNSNVIDNWSLGAYYRNPEFSTSHDNLLAQVIGYSELLKYLNKRLQNLNNANKPLFSKEGDSKFKWTSSKVALTELIYALHSSGAINSGAADIKEIASLTERIFNVELGDYYRTFLEIRNRKTGRTKFLEKLTHSLTARMDEIDE